MVKIKEEVIRQEGHNIKRKIVIDDQWEIYLPTTIKIEDFIRGKGEDKNQRSKKTAEGGLLKAKLEEVGERKKHQQTKSEGYKYKTLIKGTGFGVKVADKSGQKELELRLGWKDIKKLKIPEGIKVEVKDEVEVTIRGYNKDQVSNFIHKLRQIRPGYKDKYKQKGVGKVERVE